MKQKVLRADDFRFSEKEKDAAQNVLRPDTSHSIILSMVSEVQ